MRSIAGSYRKVRSTDTANGWFNYVALCPCSDSEVLVKVGISTIPYDRLYTIHSNSPYPVELAYFNMAGTKKRALAIERGILNAFAEFKTRGEWLKLDSSPVTKKRFANLCADTIKAVTKVPPDWRKATGSQIREAGLMKLGNAFGLAPPGS